MRQSSALFQGVKVRPFHSLRHPLMFIWMCAGLLLAGAAWWWWRAPSAGDPTLSPLARRALAEAPGPYHTARSDTVEVYAMAPEAAGAMLDEANFALVRIAGSLGVALPARPVRVILVPGDALWAQLGRERGFRPDSLALNWRDEVFLKDDGEQAARPDRVAHELVHFVLREAYGDRVPLWLDEGLAGRVGLKVSRAYRAVRGRRVTGEWPGLPAESVEPLRVLTSRTALPDDPAAARAFYRAAEELVAVIEDRIGASQLPGYVAEVIAGADWRAALEKRVNGTSLRGADVDEVVRRRVAAPRKL